MRARTLFERFTPFQGILTALVLLSLALNLILFVILLPTRSATRPLLSRSDTLGELADQAPYIREATVKLLLALAAEELNELAKGHIQSTVPISQTMSVSTDIAVNERLLVPVSLVVSDTIPVNAQVPLQEMILVPVRLDIDQVFSISTTVPFQDEIVVPIDEIIHIEERFETRVLGQDIEIPIRGDIPVKLTVTVPIDKEFPVVTDIPVAFPISETLPVEIGWTIPVNLEIPVNLPVDTQVVVPFSRTIPVDLTIPVVLDVPIDVALGDTPLGEVLLDLGERLRQVTDN